MASITQVSSGYRASVYVKGVRETKQFRTKREAGAWAAARETQLRTQVKQEPAERHTLQDAFDRYGTDVAPKHKGSDKEIIRLAAIARQIDATRPIGQVTTGDWALWRDTRLKTVKGSSVLRDIKLLNSLYEVARKEWKWVAVNPLVDLAKPRNSPHRTRTISRAEIRQQLAAMGYGRGKIDTVSKAACVVWLVALRTGMRAGEICKLPWSQVFERHMHVTAKGIGEVTRDIPITPKTRRLLDRMRGWDSTLVFAISPATLDSLFRRYRERAGLSGYTFHDSRHTAATWLARKLDVLDLCKMLGWSDPKMAMTYYNPTVHDIADRLG